MLDATAAQSLIIKVCRVSCHVNVPPRFQLRIDNQSTSLRINFQPALLRQRVVNVESDGDNYVIGLDLGAVVQINVDLIVLGDGGDFGVADNVDSFLLQRFRRILYNIYNFIVRPLISQPDK